MVASASLSQNAFYRTLVTKFGLACVPIEIEPKFWRRRTVIGCD